MKFEMKRKLDDFGRITLPLDLWEYYGIKSGEPAILLSLRKGIQIAPSEYFIMEQVPDDSIITIDESGRCEIPTVFKNQYHFEAEDTLCILSGETCILMYKD